MSVLQPALVLLKEEAFLPASFSMYTHVAVPGMHTLVSVPSCRIV